MMEMPVASLTPSSLADELKRTLSSSTLIWAVASIVVLVLAALGVHISYESALPGIILLAWIGSEVSARSPARVPIAVCEGCKKVTFLPTAWLRRLWPWRHCASCGSPMHYNCAKNHLLSVFQDEKIGYSQFCTKCGSPVPPESFAAKDFVSRLSQLLDIMPKGEQSSFYWSNMKATLARTPLDAKPSEEYWKLLRALVDRSPSIISVNAEQLLAEMIRKMDVKNWSNYWEIQDELIKARPSRFSPSWVLERVASMLENSGVEAQALTKIQAGVANALGNEKEKVHKELFGFLT